MTDDRARRQAFKRGMETLIADGQAAELISLPAALRLRYPGTDDFEHYGDEGRIK
jgi:hypothetical protein